MEASRRKFVQLLGSSPLLFMPAVGFSLGEANPEQNMTIQQVIDLILKSVPGAPFPNSVDTIKAGDAKQKVTGIVTTMFATVDVIRKTAALGANFIIAHEPTFYTHPDETKWLEKDEIYQYKIALLNKLNITIWRFHDHIHAHRPDGVLTGVLSALGWEKMADSKIPNLITMPASSLHRIIELVKKKLEIKHLRYIGDKNQVCSRIVIMPGAVGVRTHIYSIGQQKPDLIICGEISEWETGEYIRDLQASGAKTSLIVLGHSVSEEPGMEWLLTWLKPQLPPIILTHIPSGDPFSWD